MSEVHEQQQKTGHTPLSLRQRLVLAVAAPVIRTVVRLLLATCRIEVRRGQEHVDALLAADKAALLCCWHQQLPLCVGWLPQAVQKGLKPGFLVSPSRDGELVAAIVEPLGATILRGSAHRTGARAFRDMYLTLKSGVSPVMAVDGPHGPEHEAKSGTAMLAQATRAPMLAVACAASRYWQLGSWDHLMIPKPFARIHVYIDVPLECARGQSPDDVAVELGQRLEMLGQAAADDVGS